MSPKPRAFLLSVVLLLLALFAGRNAIQPYAHAGMDWLQPRDHHTPDNARSPIGTNLYKTSTGEMLWFTDQMRRNGDWLTQCYGTCNYIWNTGEQSQLVLDSDGWVVSFGDNPNRQFTHIASVNFLGSSEFVPGGQWIVLYEGEADIEYGITPFVTVTSRSPGRDVLTLTPQPDGYLTIQISNINPANHLRNIRVIPPGGLCDSDPFSYALTAGDCGGGVFSSFEQVYQSFPFHPLLLQELRYYKSLRFMQWQGTVEDQTPETWDARSELTDAIWGGGWDQSPPYELIFQLSNALDADPWVNMPHWADDEYVREFARLARAVSEPQLNVYVEYTNEVWNTAYPYSVYGNEIQAWAEARWPNALHDDGTPVSGFTKRMNFVGMRTRQICDIWRQEFGSAADQVRCVIPGGPWDFPAGEALACPLYAAEAAIPNCAADIYAVASAPYFGAYMDDRSAADGGFFDQIYAWTQEADGGLDSIFEELQTGSLLNSPGAPNGAIAGAVETMRNNKRVTDQYGLHLIAYEGGQHLTPLSALGVQCNQWNSDPACPPYRAIQSLYVAANRDPRMGQMYTDYLNAWQREGGELFAHYHAISQHGPNYGSWAAKEYVGQPNSAAPKYQAILDFITANPCWWDECRYPEATPGPGTPTWTPTPTRTGTPTNTPTPTPTPLTGSVHVYWDSLGASWDSWSWGTTIDFAASSPAQSGNAAVAVTFDEGFAGFRLHSYAPVPMTGNERIRFWLHGGSAGGQEMLLRFGDLNDVLLDTFATVSAQAGTWTQIDLPISGANAPGYLGDFLLQSNRGSAQPIFYVDSIEIYVPGGAGATPTATFTPAITPTPTHTATPTNTQPPGGPFLPVIRAVGYNTHNPAISGMAPLAIHTHAISSTLASGTILTARYEWDFGDGTATSRYNEVVGWGGGHVYDAPGTYTVTLRITDETGAVGRATSQVNVLADSRTRIYVAANGDDANDGRSESTPIRTIARAQALLANNTAFLFRRGDTFDVAEPLFYLLDNDNILFGAYGSGPRPRLETDAVWSEGSFGSVVNLRRSTNVIVQDWDVRHTGITAPPEHLGTLNAVRIVEASRNVTVRNSYFDNLTSNVVIDPGAPVPAPAGILVQDNEGEDVSHYHVWGSGVDVTVQGNRIANSLNGHTMRYNGVRIFIYDNDFGSVGYNSADCQRWIGLATCPGHQALSGQTGTWVYAARNIFRARLRISYQTQYGATIVTDAVYENNRIVRTADLDFPSLRIFKGTQRIDMRNNIFENGQFAIRFDTEGVEQAANDIRIVHNTFIDGTGRQDGSFLESQAAWPGDSNFLVANNLYVQPSFVGGNRGGWPFQVQAPSLAGFSFQRNLWQTPANGPTHRVGDSELTAAQWLTQAGVDGDLFHSLAPASFGANFAPPAASAADGYALTLPGITRDFHGNPRPATGRTVGAVEIAPASTPTPTVTPTPTPTPTPTATPTATPTPPVTQQTHNLFLPSVNR